jgi:hypothetical protein
MFVLACSAMLALTPTAATSVRLLVNALVMDGTTFPTPSPGFIQSAIDDFINPTVPGRFTGIPVTTPEQAVGINQSVRDGLADLEAAMAEQARTNPGKPYVVFGFSQSTVITMLEKAELAERTAQGLPVPDVTFVGIGVGNRPNGGIAERLDGLVIPFFDFTFNGAAPTDSGFVTIDIARQYDGLADTPEFLINPVADLNAILGVVFVHALYGEEISLDPASPKYVPGTVEQQYGDTTYYWIPTAELPLFDPLRLIGVPEPVIDIVEPFFKVLVEAGYDRTVPFGQPTPAQLIPVIDPVTLTIQLAQATLDGVNNAAHLFGAELPGYPALTQLLTAAESTSADVIGAPYRSVVSAINANFNPILAFNRIEAPIAARFDGVVNALGIPTLLNKVVDATLFPLTAWAESNILFPQANTAATATTEPARASTVDSTRGMKHARADLNGSDGALKTDAKRREPDRRRQIATPAPHVPSFEPAAASSDQSSAGGSSGKPSAHGGKKKADHRSAAGAKWNFRSSKPLLGGREFHSGRRVNV